MTAVLVATDFSEFARTAYPHAQRLAAALGLPLKLVHIVNYLGPSPHPTPGTHEDRATRELHEHVAEERALLEQGGFNVETLVRDGLPARELLALLEGDYAMCVMASHRHGGLRSMLPGAVVSKVVRHSPKPVLVVPEPCDDTPVRRILMPIDFSEISSGAMEQALDLARAYGASLDLLHVVVPVTGLPPVPPPDTPRPVPDAAHRFEKQTQALDQKVELARQRGVEARPHVTVGAVPAPVICEFASDNDVDLIIMPAHGYHGFSRLMLGSVAEEVMRSSDDPVLVIKPARTYAEVTTDE